MSVNEHGFDEPRAQCVDCGNWITNPIPCHVCEWRSDEAYHYVGIRLDVDQICNACAQTCINCKKPTCDTHMTGRECINCAGPSDCDLEY